MYLYLSVYCPRKIISYSLVNLMFNSLRYSVFDDEYFIKLLKISSQAWFLSYFSLKYTFLFLLIQKLFKVFGFLRLGKRTKPPKNLHILFSHQVLL